MKNIQILKRYKHKIMNKDVEFMEMQKQSSYKSDKQNLKDV